jgi:hypothetical protein
MYISCQRGSHGKTDGNYRSDGERKKEVKNKDSWKKVETYSISNPANFPLTTVRQNVTIFYLKGNVNQNRPSLSN